MSFGMAIASARPPSSSIARPLRPPLVVAEVWYAMGRSLQGFRAGDDLDQFLRDHRLTGTVVSDRLLANHVAGVACRVVHRRHLRAVERGVVFKERTENLHGNVTRQKLG